MNTIVGNLVQGLIKRLNITPPGQRILIGLSGVPGSGKSQLGEHIIDRLNTEARCHGYDDDDDDIAILVSIDGWHLTRAQLDRLSDPQLAKERRGAIWTFDGKAYSNFVALLRSSSSCQTLWAPSFSHSKKDPVPMDVAILPQHRLVILEGLYANISEGDFAPAAKLYDERWVIHCDEDLIKARLVARHLATGVAQSVQEAQRRVATSDIPNGHYLLQHVLQPAIYIESVEDVVWTGT